jgi:hypothetical protein
MKGVGRIKRVRDQYQYTTFGGLGERGVCTALGLRSRKVLTHLSSRARAQDQECLDTGLDPFRHQVEAISRTVSGGIP